MIDKVSGLLIKILRVTKVTWIISLIFGLLYWPLKKMPQVTWTRTILLIIVILFGMACWLLSPSGTDALHREDKADLGLRLGLDLKGGTQLLYQVEFPEDMTDENDQQRQLDASVSTIEKRVNKLGVVEPVIQKQGNDKIWVQLPGISNLDQAKSLVEETAYLEFREVELNGSSIVTLDDYLSSTPSAFFDSSVTGSRFFYTQNPDYPLDPMAILNIKDGVPIYTDIDGNVITDTSTLDGTAISWMPATGTLDGKQQQLIGSYLSNAYPQMDQTTYDVSVGIQFNSDGIKIFNDIAARLYTSSQSGSLQNELGIVLDSQLISRPEMHIQKTTDGKASITGDYTWDEANTLAIQLTSGALTIKLDKLLYEDNVSAILGKDFVHRATIAGLVGLMIVMLFMLLYYRGLGLVACISLLIYTVLVLAIYKWIPVTLTLAGIGAFVVSLGMAVDANVLIFERVKEELRAGKTIGAAIEAGFSRAWSAIRDSNFTTFIACGVLYWFSTNIVANSQVKGFALTLVIGVAVSMFSAITVSHMLLRISASFKTVKRYILPKPEQNSTSRFYERQ